MSTAIPVQPVESSPALALTPYDTADIPDLNRLLSHGYSARAAIHLKVGDLDAALADLDSALRLFADNSEALHLRGLVHQLRGDQGQAEIDLQLAAHLGRPSRESETPASSCELCYRVTGDTDYVDLVLKSFPLTPEGRREAIRYANAVAGDSPERDLVRQSYDFEIVDLRVEVFEYRSLTIRRLIHTQE